MRLSQVREMLEQNPHPQEETWCRLDDGVGYVAARTEMPDCSGKMIDWWFRNLRTTEQYKRWYPEEHVWSGWRGPSNSYVGGTHLVHERLGTPNLAKLKINFRDPATILDMSRARKAGVSLVVYGRGGPLGLPLWTGHVMHMVHDHEGGCTMRSRYWLGDIAPAGARALEVDPERHDKRCHAGCHAKTLQNRDVDPCNFPAGDLSRGQRACHDTVIIDNLAARNLDASALTISSAATPISLWETETPPLFGPAKTAEFELRRDAGAGPKRARLLPTPS